MIFIFLGAGPPTTGQLNACSLERFTASILLLENVQLLPAKTGDNYHVRANFVVEIELMFIFPWDSTLVGILLGSFSF
jgi:hypothetical protein